MRGIKAFSPDGKWIAFQSRRGGKDTIWKIPVDGGAPVQLTDKSSFRPLFSPDGKFISCAFYEEQVNPPRYRAAKIPADGGAPFRVFDLPDTVNFGDGFWWTADGRALTYVDTRNDVSNIWSLRIDSANQSQLTNFSSKKVFYYALSPDGKSFAMARGAEVSDVVLIRDFR